MIKMGARSTITVTMLGAPQKQYSQEAEVERLSKELSKMQNVSIQANVVTVSAGTDSGVESGEEDGPPPAPGTQSQDDVTDKQVGWRIFWHVSLDSYYILYY